jgi:hypothetical protein
MKGRLSTNKDTNSETPKTLKINEKRPLQFPSFPKSEMGEGMVRKELAPNGLPIWITIHYHQIRP